MVTHPQAGISICSGISGLDIGVSRAIGPSYRTVCFLEGEAYAAAVLAARMEDGALCDAPIWSDVKTFDGKPWRGKVDCITAGYPCQPFSNAGKRAGEQDPRHLWPAIATIIRDVQPQWVFCENVPGHVSIGLQQVIADLEGLGYKVEAGLFSAEECGAPHVRQRLFLLAYADSPGLRDHVDYKQHANNAQAKPCDYGPQRHVAYADSVRQLQQEGSIKKQRGRLSDSCQQNVDGPIKRAMGRATDGLCSGMDRPWADGWERDVQRTTTGQPYRTDRLRALGNAVVPAVAQKAFICLLDNHIKTKVRAV